MFLRLSPEEESIKDIFVSFFDAECSIERVRNAEESGFDATAWERFIETCLLYTSPSPRDRTRSRMPSSA